jgi:predicted TIM-barrel fold metal-dependent hydrolase
MAANLCGDPPVTRAGWIDAHTHIWTPDLRKYPLAEGYTAASMVPRSFTPEELFRVTRPAGVERIVLIQMSYYGFDNSYMTDMMAQHPGIFGGVAVVDHHSPTLVDTMKQLLGQGVRGFRLYPPQDPTSPWLGGDAMARFWQQAAEGDQAICLLINPTELPSVDAMCERFPETRVVIDHFARIGVSGSIDSARVDQLCRLARHRNVYVKTSAFYALGKKKGPYDDLRPMIRRLRDAFGAGRLMWASDNPYQVQPPHVYMDSLLLIRDRLDFLTADEKDQMLRGTAARVFFGENVA